MPLGRGLSLQRTYWIPMTIAIVLKPDFTATVSRGVLRIAGTFAGLLLATGLFHLIHTGVGTDIALMAVFTFLLRWNGPANYGVFVTALSAMIVLLIATTGVAPKDVIAARAVNTAGRRRARPDRVRALAYMGAHAGGARAGRHDRRLSRLFQNGDRRVLRRPHHGHRPRPRRRPARAFQRRSLGRPHERRARHRARPSQYAERHPGELAQLCARRDGARIGPLPDPPGARARRHAPGSPKKWRQRSKP